MRFAFATILNDLCETVARRGTGGAAIGAGPAPSDFYCRTVAALSESAPFPDDPGPTPLPEIDLDRLTADGFTEMSRGFRAPLAVRGFHGDSVAVRDWSLQFFATRYGDTQLPVVRNGETSQHARYVADPRQADYAYLRVADLVDAIERGEGCYLNNVSRIFGLYPELLDDMGLDRVQTYTGIDLVGGHDVTNMFFGGEGTGTPLHCAVSGNFLFNVKGRKHWYLIDPRYSRHVAPRVSPTALYAYSTLDICNAAPTDRVLRIPRYEITLEEGDLLFIPAWWWHAVVNRSPYTIACAHRFRTARAAISNSPLYSFLAILHMRATRREFALMGDSKQERNLNLDKAVLRDFLKRDADV